MTWRWCSMSLVLACGGCLVPHNRPFERTARVDTRAAALVLPPAGPALVGAPLRENSIAFGGTISTQVVVPRTATRDEGTSGDVASTLSGGGYFAVRLRDTGYEVGAALEFASASRSRPTYGEPRMVDPIVDESFHSGRGWIFSRASFGQRFGGGLSVALGVAGVETRALSDFTVTTRFLDNGQVLGGTDRVVNRYHGYAFDGAFGGQFFARFFPWLALSGGASLVVSPTMFGRREAEASCRGVGSAEESRCAGQTFRDLSLPARFSPPPDHAVTLTPWISLDISIVWVTLSAQLFANALSTTAIGQSVPLGGQFSIRTEFEYAPRRASRSEPQPVSPAVNASPDEPQARGARTL
ncbi:MAG: hypothetical protein JNK05_28085 [Myxococcales bacterium]|nr:hypothetical protein [Myxococcales bacterium]